MEDRQRTASGQCAKGTRRRRLLLLMLCPEFLVAAYLLLTIVFAHVWSPFVRGWPSTFALLGAGGGILCRRQLVPESQWPSRKELVFRIASALVSVGLLTAT